MNRGPAGFYFAISLVSVSTLVYEIGLTRIFSISQGYHFAFMVISIALLGIGVGGALITVSSGRWSVVSDQKIPVHLSALSALFSIVAILSFLAANQIIFDPVRAAWSRVEFLKIMAQYLILSVPFIISGMILSLAYRSMSAMVHRLYLADMAGAGVGCLLVLYIFSRSGGEGVVTVSAVLSLTASLLFLSSSTLEGKGLFVPIMAKVLLFIAVLGSNQFLEIRMSPYRELSSVLNFPGARIVDTFLSPSGRMDVVDSPAVRAAPGISLTYQDPLPRQLGFTLNGGGLSTITDPEGDLSFLRHLPSSLPYRIRKGGDVFVVDPGGGMEALSAFENGAKGVWGSETRGIVVSTMKGELSTVSGDLYNRIDAGHGYGRNVIRESGRAYDVIQLPLTDTLGSSSSGMMGLQEEYNLTVEAFTEYLGHLKKDGFISASVYLLPPPRQELKLLSTIAAALETAHPPTSSWRPADRIIAVRSWGVLTILAKNGAVTGSEIAAVKAFCEEERFDLVWYPGMREEEADVHNRFPEPMYHREFRRFLEGDRERFYRDYIFDVTPATDDRPFFGQTFRMTRVKDTYESVGRKWGILIEGGYLLPWILVQAIAASVILIIFPLFVMRNDSHLTLREKGTALFPITIYFSAIGLGFMFLEISLMQRVIPVLGEPVYAISSVLFSILVSTGLGSYISGRFRLIERHTVHIILIVPLLAVIYLFMMGSVPVIVAGSGLLGRYLLTFIFFVPLGIAMGIPFPAGISILGRDRPDLIPWAWCINGSFSVVSSVLAMMLALSWGFSAVHMLAAGCYIIAWLAIMQMRQR